VKVGKEGKRSKNLAKRENGNAVFQLLWGSSLVGTVALE